MAHTLGRRNSTERTTPVSFRLPPANPRTKFTYGSMSHARCFIRARRGNSLRDIRDSCFASTNNRYVFPRMTARYLIRSCAAEKTCLGETRVFFGWWLVKSSFVSTEYQSIDIVVFWVTEIALSSTVRPSVRSFDCEQSETFGLSAVSLYPVLHDDRKTEIYVHKSWIRPQRRVVNRNFSLADHGWQDRVPSTNIVPQNDDLTHKGRLATQKPARFSPDEFQTFTTRRNWNDRRTTTIAAF